MHALGVAHRDIKLDKLFVDTDCSLVVADFAVAGGMRYIEAAAIARPPR